MRMPKVNVCPSVDEMENELKKMLIEKFSIENIILDVYRYWYTQWRMDYQNELEGEWDEYQRWYDDWYNDWYDDCEMVFR